MLAAIASKLLARNSGISLSPFLQHDLAFGTELCAERKRDVDVEARDLAGIVDIGERRIAAGRGDT